MRVVFFGTPEFAVPSLTALIEGGYEVTAVVTQPDKPRSRNCHSEPSVVKKAAKTAGIETLEPDNLHSEDFITALARYKPEAAVVAAYGKLIPSSVLGIPALGFINVHPSLLPRYRGAAPIQWAIINGDKKTGVSIMLLDEGMDTGPVFMAEEMAIEESDTSETLSLRLSALGARLLVETLRGIAGGLIRAIPQTGEPVIARQLTKQDGLINFGKPAVELANLVRGLHPWPGAYTFMLGERIKVLRARPVASLVEAPSFKEPEIKRSPPGTVAGQDGDTILLTTGKGLLAVSEVQPQGKRPMTFGAFLRGRLKGRYDLTCPIITGGGPDGG